MVLAAAKWVGSKRERKRRGLLCLCGRQSLMKNAGKVPCFERLARISCLFYLWVLPWLLMERNETQKVEGGRQIKGWKKWGKQSQQPSIWEDLLLKILIAYPTAYTACSNICSDALPFRIKLHKGLHSRSIHLLWCNFPYISYQGR